MADNTRITRHLPKPFRKPFNGWLDILRTWVEERLDHNGECSATFEDGDYYPLRSKLAKLDFPERAPHCSWSTGS